MTEYTITIENEDGIDIVTLVDPVAAVETIQNARIAGDDVTYTGDPFKAAVLMVSVW